MLARGFILQASYRVIESRPVVHLFGVLENGQSFLVRDSREAPYFYVRAQDADVPELRNLSVQSTERTNFSGEPVSRVTVRVPQEAPLVRDALHRAGVETYEADVRFAVRYLIDRGIRGACLIDGEANPGQGVALCFDNPVLSPAEFDPDLRVLSFDIETDPNSARLLAISVYGCGADEVYIVDPKRRTMPQRAIGFEREADVLRHFTARVRELDPDVLTGWNVIDFDLTFLQEAAERLGVQFSLGRSSGAMRLRAAEGYFGSGSANIPGRLVLDGIDLIRGAFIRYDDYSLDAVARTVLGEGKAVQGDVTDRVDEILAGYHNDLVSFAEYARTDARLVLQILEKLDLLTLAVERSRLTGMTPDRVAASIASFDFLYLAELYQRQLVAPSVRSADSRVHVAQAGGHVLDSVPGMHINVWVFDFKSLYPSIIRTFNIDPVGIDSQSSDGELADIDLPGGARFQRAEGILPGILDELFTRRQQAQAEGDQITSQAIKILMNSFYGVLGTPACRFYDPRIANAITGQGRYLLLWSEDWFKQRGYQVLYGDTDSLFVSAGELAGTAAVQQAQKLAAELTHELAAHIQNRWQLSSRMELEFEKLYEQLMLPYIRNTKIGARKRYVGRVYDAEPDALDFVGMEVVRRDWTELAKNIQRTLYQRLFAEEPVVDYIRDTVQALRAGELDDQLVYRRGLRRGLDDYVRNTPPHVVAARKSATPAARIVRYKMTQAGPEPLDNLHSPLDYTHYLDKQVLPVAQPILQALGIEFAQAIGDDRQIGLF